MRVEREREAERQGGNRSRGSKRHVETGRISARLKVLEVVGARRRESSGLLQKKKQEWV